MLSIQSLAPDFTLPDEHNVPHTLSDYRGKWVLLYFYPKDNTPGCTAQACSIRDTWSDFRALDAVVFGVSADSVSKHATFRSSKNLPFTLLSDGEKKVVQLYDVYAPLSFLGKEFFGIQRISYLINPKGVIVHVFDTVNTKTHGVDVLAVLTSLKNADR